MIVAILHCSDTLLDSAVCEKINVYGPLWLHVHSVLMGEKINTISLHNRLLMHHVEFHIIEFDDYGDLKWN